MERLARHNHDGVNADKISWLSLIDKPRPIGLRHSIRAMFETAGRYAGAASGAASVRTYDTQGLNLTSGTASGAYAYNEIVGDLATLNIFDTPIDMDFVLNWSAEANGTHRGFVVVGSVGGPGSTFTEKHIGFEFIANATNKVRGTVGNGSTRTTTDLDLTGITLADDNIYTATYLPKQGVVFFINGRRVGAITNPTILPTGVPTDTAVWSEQKSIRDNSGTSVNTIILRWLNIHLPLEGAYATKL